MNSDYDLLFKILLLGDSGVGKSCIILRYTENQFNQNLMNSIGVDFKLKTIDYESHKVKLQIWDTAGQERFRTITTSYYKGAHAIIIVYDISDLDSFNHIKNWMSDIDKFARENVLRFLVGNKCDMEHTRQVTYDQGKELAKYYGISFMETSAKDVVNIEELFLTVTKVHYERQTTTCYRKDMRKSLTTNTITMTTLSTNENKKGGCC